MTQCRYPVTRHAFEIVCNAPNFEACQRYAEKVGKLKSPFQWLQHKAVEVGGRVREVEDRR